MSLPTLNKPTFETDLPSTGEKITFRPFLVEEENILLHAKESGDRVDLIRAIKQVVQNCVTTPDFDADKMSTFDMEWMFVQLRARSINNIVEAIIMDEDDGIEYPLEVDLDKVVIVGDVKNNKVDLVEDPPVGVVMTFPTPAVSEKLKDVLELHQVTYQLVKMCIKEVYDEENVYPWNENSEQEKDKWLKSLSVQSYDKLREYFINMPRMFYEDSYTNSEGTEKKVKFQTLDDFFSWD